MIRTSASVGLNKMVAWCTRGLVLSTALAVSVAVAEEPAEQKAVGENVALRAKYTLGPQPGYRYCTDPGDTTQLTDGKSTTDHFWTQKGTVGWSNTPYAVITIDLGRVEPIAGVSFNTAAGVAGVTWPAAIRVMVSDDGKAYRDVGDLVAMDHKANGPWPDGYAIRRLVASELHTRGRFVRLMVLPLPSGSYMFVDEVEVIRGPAELLQREPGGQPVGTVREVFEQGRLQRSVRVRFDADVHGLGGAIAAAKLPDESVRKRLLDRLAEVRGQLDPAAIGADESFRAVLPLNDVHGRLFGVQADLWKSLGCGSLSAWAPSTWDPVDPFAVPPSSSPAGVIEVHTMRGEYRSAALNLANSTSGPMRIRLSFDGLPGGPTPGYLTLHEVAWTDTARGKPVAAALPEAERGDGTWTVTVTPGLVRQVWMTWHVRELPPGEHSGRIVVGGEGIERLTVPVRLRVWPLEFPKRTTLYLGGWSYTNGGGAYGITSTNRKQFLDHLRQRFVNAPWATSAVMMSFKFPEDEPGKIRLDTRQFGEWLRQWPDAGRYLVFLSVGNSCGGAKIGTPQFDRRVGLWISAWVRYLGDKGISPGQLGLLIRDEPHEGSDTGPIVAWAKAITAAQPEVLVWEDPTYRDPTKAPGELFDVCHVLCPNRPMWLRGGKPFAQFYLDQQRKGRTLELYSCSGPARLLDPYSYYRLQAWHCWSIGATGSYFWAYGDNGGSSSWNEYFSKHGPYTPLFVDDRTVTAGKQMEAIRESVEDYEYFVMLRKAVAKAKSAPALGPAVAEAESLLGTAAEKVLNDPEAKNIEWHAPKDRTKADAARVAILRALTALGK